MHLSIKQKYSGGCTDLRGRGLCQRGGIDNQSAEGLSKSHFSVFWSYFYKKLSLKANFKKTGVLGINKFEVRGR